jgi:tetratricopeptide (TPR) repeat protein
MSKKQLFSFIFLFLLLQIAHLAKAQKNSEEIEKQALNLFKKEQYSKAAILFEQAAVARKSEHPVDEKYAEMLLYSAVSFERTENYENAQKNYLSSYFILKDINKGKSKKYAIVCYNLASLYHLFAKFNKAEYFYIRAKHSYQEIYGVQNANYASSCYNLGRLYFDFGLYTQAERFLSEAKDIRESLLGKNSSDYAESCGALAKLYDNFGKYTQAESLYRQENYFMSGSFGKKHPFYATSCFNLGEFYVKLGKYKKSKGFFNEAKIIYEAAPDDDKLYNSLIYNNLAAIYQNLKDYEKAETFYLKSKKIRERILGTQNPRYAASCYRLAELYRLKGKYEIAKYYCVESKNIREDILTKKHLDYAHSCALLGLIEFNKSAAEKSKVIKLENYKQAEILYTEAKGIYKNLFSETYLDYALLNNYTAELKYETAKLSGTYIQKNKEFRQALPFYLEAQKTTKKILGNINPIYLKISTQLARLYTDLEQLAKAEALYLKVNKTYENIYGNKYPEYIESCEKLASFYMIKKDSINTELYYNKAKTAIAALYGKQDVSYTQICTKLAGFYHSNRAYAKAEALFIEAKTIDEQLQGQNNAINAQNCTNLADLYIDMRKYEEAKTLYLQAKNIQQRINGKQSGEYALACDKLADLYLLTENYGKAEALYIEAKQITNKNENKYSSANANANKKLAFLYEQMAGNELVPNKQYKLHRKAERYFVEAKKIEKTVFSNTQPVYAQTCTQLADVYLHIAELSDKNLEKYGLYKQAEALLIVAKEAILKAKGEQHADYAKSCAKLGDLYLLMSDIEQDKKEKNSFNKKAYALFLNAIHFGSPPENEYPFYTESLEKYSRLALLLNETQQAEIGYFSLHDSYKRLFGKNNFLYARSCINLAAVYQKKKNEAQAVPLYLEANEILNTLLRENTLFMEDKARLDLENKARKAIDLFQAYALTKQKRNGKFIDLVYNNSLLLKQGIPRSYLSIQKRVQQTGDTIFIKLFNKMNSYGVAWVQQNDLPVAKRDSDIIELSGEAKIIEDEFIKYAAKKKAFWVQSNLESSSWIKIQNTLEYGETTLDFLKTNYHNGQELTDSILYFALLLRKNDVHPKAIYLFSEKQLQNLLENENEADSVCAKRLYSIKSPQRDNLYNLVFKHLERYLQKTKILYISPTGLLNNIAFDAIIGKGRWTLSRWYDIYYLNSMLERISDNDLYAKDIATVKQLKIINNEVKITQTNTQPLQSNYFLAGGNALFKNKSKAYSLKNGQYTVEDILKMNLTDAELIVLSENKNKMCTDTVETPANLRKAFKKAGAGYLLYSLWKIPSNLRKEFMTSFYKNWYSGMEIRKAFKETRQQIKQKYAKSAKANQIWAAFVLME